MRENRLINARQAIPVFILFLLRNGPVDQNTILRELVACGRGYFSNDSITLSELTAMLRQLENDGFIERQTPKGKKRNAVVYSVTARERARAEQYSQTPERSAYKILSAFRHALRGLLYRVLGRSRAR